MSDQTFHQQESSQSTRDVAMEETKSVGQDAKQGAKQVAQTAGAEAQAVVGEAKAQVASLYDTLRQDVTGQARDQTQRAASGLQDLAGEISKMAEGSGSGSGVAAGLARQAAERVDAAAYWLEGREPADLLEEVRRYARRSPGTFLAACAVVGFVGGRLTRSLRDDAQGQQDSSGQGDRQAFSPVTTAPQPMSFEGGYGGRPAAVTGGTVDMPGVPAAAGTVTSGPVGTAAGNPLPGAPIVAGDGEDVYTDVDDLEAGEPFADAPDLGQGAAGTGFGEGDRR